MSFPPPVVGMLLAACLVIGVSPLSAADPVRGNVSQVTLYQGQALVTRVIPVEGAAGALEIVVSDLPEQIVGASLFAETEEGIEIRAVRFRTRAVGQQPREEVRKIEEAIQATQHKTFANQQAHELLNKRTAYLDQLEGFVAGTAKGDLAKGALDAESLQKVSLFSFEQRKSIADERLKLTIEAEELQKQLQLLNKQRAELTAGASQLVREAVIFLQKNAGGAAQVRLNYLVGGCGWSPSYVFRGTSGGKEVNVEYNALIQQLTGEDWSNVSLTLSTASPALSASVPGLAPFHVSLTQNGGEGKKAPQQEVTAQLAQIRQSQTLALNEYRNTLDLNTNIDVNWRLNTTANDFQCIELKNPKDMLTASYMAISEEQGPSLSYKLGSPVSLPSRNDQQMVRILHAQLKSRFYYVATPLLQSFVYREAELANGSPEDLLGGPVTVYLDGRFVGRGEIPTVARAETFVVGFGADPQLRARRELADRTESVQGGNREISFRYRLLIENFKEEEVEMRLYDRLPHSERSGEVRVTLSAMQDGLSDDKSYLRKERPKGILRWDVQVAGGSTGDKAKVVEYDYRVEFDRSYTLTAASEGRVILEQQKEFEDLQRARSKR